MKILSTGRIIFFYFLLFYFKNNKKKHPSLFYYFFRYTYGSYRTNNEILKILNSYEIKECKIIYGPIFERLTNNFEDVDKILPVLRNFARLCKIKRNYILLNYIIAMIDGDFRKAYRYWKFIQNVQIKWPRNTACLSNFQGRSSNIAIVLPGAIQDEYFSEISKYGLVGKLNPKFKIFDDEIVKKKNAEYVFFSKESYIYYLNRIKDRGGDFWIVDVSCSNLEDTQSKFELQRIASSYSELTFIVLSIVDWCLNNDLYPVLYFGDFYLGERLYEDKEYDFRKYLNNRTAIINAYFTHDVFFVHNVLRELKISNQIKIRGYLDEITDLSPYEFSKLLECRWKYEVVREF